MKILKSINLRNTFLLSSLLMSATALHSEDIQVGETTRNAIIYAPENLKAHSPLLISMHGMSQDAAYQKNQAKWENVADTAGFVVVYPNGINNAWDISGTRDVDYILTIIDTIYNRYEIDKNRVYLSGFSMGGMMTYHAANLIADKIAAFAPVSGVPMWGGTYNSCRPIPIIHVHGDADDVVTYDNRIVPYIEGWVKRNNCNSKPVITKPYPANKPGSTAYKTFWGNGDDNTEITLLTLGGKGHWHSNDPNSVMTSTEIWNFVRRYSLNPGAPIISIKSPQDGAILENGESITILPNITNTESDIVKVEFFDGDNLISSLLEAPFEFIWNNIPVGDHKIKVVAYNSENKNSEAVIRISMKPPKGAVLMSSVPDNNSFDLNQDELNLSFFFNERVNSDLARAFLRSESEEFEINVKKKGFTDLLEFIIPQELSLPNGSYTLYTKNIINESGAVALEESKISFVIGQVLSNGEITVFNPDIKYECDNINGSIPYGWKRVMGNDIAESGSKGMGGSRVMFFDDGGDFDAGFYMSPRGSGSSCQIFYGSYGIISGSGNETKDYSLKLSADKYRVKFYTAFWNTGAMSNNRKINFIVRDENNNIIISAMNLASELNLSETANCKIEGAALHEFEFELKEETSIVLEWNVIPDLGWDGMILGGVKISTIPPLSYICKENLTNAINSAQNIYNLADKDHYQGSQRNNLKELIDYYRNFSSTSPVVYEKAIKEILLAEKELKNHMQKIDDTISILTFRINRSLGIGETLPDLLLSIETEDAENSIDDDDFIANNLNCKIKEYIETNINNGKLYFSGDNEIPDNNSFVVDSIDVTGFIKNPNFYTYQTFNGLTDSSFPGWLTSGITETSDINKGINSLASADQEVVDTYCEFKSDGKGRISYFNQEIKNLPDGKYNVYIKARRDDPKKNNISIEKVLNHNYFWILKDDKSDTLKHEFPITPYQELPDSYIGFRNVYIKDSRITIGVSINPFPGYTPVIIWGDPIISMTGKFDELAASIDYNNEEHEIYDIKYYDINGFEISEPKSGINIIKTIYKDGTSNNEKLIIR